MIYFNEEQNHGQRELFQQISEINIYYAFDNYNIE